jgi:hypothetical protein
MPYPNKVEIIVYVKHISYCQYCDVRVQEHNEAWAGAKEDAMNTLKYEFLLSAT